MKVPFASHPGTKIMALVLAVFLWGFAYWRNTKTGNVTCKIIFKAPAGLLVVPKDKEMNVEVKGSREKVEALEENGTVYIAKTIEEAELERFGTADEMLHSVTITAEDISAESGLTFPQLPKSVDLTLRRIGETELDVKIVVAESPAPGYVYVKEKSSTWPPRVTVRGPKSLLDRTEYIETQKFYLTDLSAPREEEHPLVSKIDGEEVIVSPAEVRVTVHVEQEPAEKPFEKIPVLVLIDQGYPYKAKTDPPTVTVTVRGPAEKVGSLEAKSIVAFARVEANLLPDENAYTEDVHVTVPEELQGLVSVTVSQETVKVYVTE